MRDTRDPDLRSHIRTVYLIYTLGASSPPTNFRHKERRMHSAFRTLFSFAGVLAVCYIITAASWVQVLLLFFAASIGWCLLSFALTRQRATNSRARYATSDSSRSRVPQEAEQPQAEASEAAQKDRSDTGMSQPSGYTYRFPIHKLSSRPMPL
jgi:hypothetical protein